MVRVVVPGLGAGVCGPFWGVGGRGVGVAVDYGGGFVGVSAWVVD